MSDAASAVRERPQSDRRSGADVGEQLRGVRALRQHERFCEAAEGSRSGERTWGPDYLYSKSSKAIKK